MAFDYPDFIHANIPSDAEMAERYTLTAQQQAIKAELFARELIPSADVASMELDLVLSQITEKTGEEGADQAEGEFVGEWDCDLKEWFNTYA